jgi:hypothetical protein
MKQFRGTGDFYTVVAEDEGIALGCRVTISNMETITVRFAAAIQAIKTAPTKEPQHFGCRHKTAFIGDDHEPHFGWNLDKTDIPVFEDPATIADWQAAQATNNITTTVVGWIIEQVKLGGFTITNSTKETVLDMVTRAFPVLKVKFVKPKNIFNELKITDKAISDDTGAAEE